MNDAQLTVRFKMQCFILAVRCSHGRWHEKQVRGEIAAGDQNRAVADWRQAATGKDESAMQ